MEAFLLLSIVFIGLGVMFIAVLAFGAAVLYAGYEPNQHRRPGAEPKH